MVFSEKSGYFMPVPRRSSRASRPRPRLSGCGLTLLCALALAVPARAADPTPEQQFWLELINRMRQDPAGELQRLAHFSAPGVWDSVKADDPWVQFALDFYGTDAATLQTQWDALVSAPPLAWSASLADSAAAYSDLMVQADQQSHTLDGLSLQDRILAGGYSASYLELGESLFASVQNVVHGHSGFAIDWGDDDANPGNGYGTGIQTPALHREVMMDRLIKEAGIGFQSLAIPGGNLVATGPLVVTQHFGSQYRFTGSQYVSDAIVTGVVYADDVLADDFYTPGEGLAGVMIEVWDAFTGTLLTSGLTNSAGGFNLVAQDLVIGRGYVVRAPETGLSDVTFIASASEEDYGAPVLVYDNAYARFQVVPEPGSLLLALCAALLLHSPRHRSTRR